MCRCAIKRTDIGATMPVKDKNMTKNKHLPVFVFASTAKQSRSPRSSGSLPRQLVGREDGLRRGFTIIEMMVAVALFAIVMIISVGALLSLVAANRKAQALQSVMNNLNVTIDSMVRSMREGVQYHCGNTGPIQDPRDCLGGDQFFAFERYGGLTTNPNDQRVYRFGSGSECGTNCIERSDQSGAAGTWVRITAPEVLITDMQFYVMGTIPGDEIQPKVVIVIKGTAGGATIKTTSTFHIQATAVQRVLDLSL